ncbi:hypothetical protein J1614_006581 [Plenodomus biglobosus]|nr:hypothetical protein J1614_006581 [Plenodomus biglobosus]
MPSPPTNPTNPTYFSPATELADLGRERFDHDTAQITSRDHALLSHAPVTVRAGKPPKGLEAKVFEWNVFQHTTAERDDREELKGDLHEGQLHRQNRAARETEGGGGGGGGFGGSVRGGFGGGGMGGFGSGRGKSAKVERDDGLADALCAGRKPEGGGAPLAKGFAEELDKSMFWDGPIV